MDVNDLRRKVHQIIFDTCVLLDSQSDAANNTQKKLEYRPGHNASFQIVVEEKGETTTTKFTAIIPAIDFYMLQLPR